MTSCFTTHLVAERSPKRRWLRRGTSVATALLLALSPVLSTAQEDGAVEAFRSHVERGVELRKAGKPREAIPHFKKARAIADHPKLAYVTGQLYEAIGDCGTARAEYQAGLDDGRAAGAIEQKLNEAMAANAECVDRGMLEVECSPQGATLTVNGDTLTCPAAIELSAGKHTLQASAPGRQTRSVPVTIEPAGQYHQRIELGVPWQKTAVTYTTYGALGLGGALFVGGILSDASAGSRQEELADASNSGDVQRTRRLAEDAESAQNTTIALYSTGLILLAGGTALWFYGAEAEALLTEGNDPASAQVHVTADGAVLEATFRW